MTKFNTLNVWGFGAAIHGARNPLKSWDKSDSNVEPGFILNAIGDKDWDLLKRLWKAGTEHRKYLRQIWVWVDITLPRYVWSEFDTYKIGTSANSESTMHTLLKEDFSYDQFEWPPFENADWDMEASFKDYIDNLRTVRDRANELEGKDRERMHQILKAMLPESFLQMRTINVNYETLATMYRQRKNHRLPQWSKDFVEWVHTLPYSEFITGEFND